MMTSFVEVLRTRAHEVPERVAYTFLVDGEAEEVKLTYGELDQQARSIAARLVRQRLQGQRVLLLYPPGLEYIAAFWGCLYAGVVAVPAYPPRLNRSLERLQAIVADSEAAGILTMASTLVRMEPLLAETTGLEQVCRVTTDDVSPDLAADWHAPEIKRESLAFLQYTSGSTAIPKGVMVTHGNLLHNESLIQRAFRQTQDSIIVGWLPLYHDMGLIGTVLQPVFAGGRCILMSHVAFLQRPLRWLEAITRYRATTSGAPNFAYDLCARKATAEERDQLDLSSWTTAFNGSEPVRAHSLENFAATFKSCGFRPTAFFPCYGLAEATLFVSGGFKSDSPVGKSFAAKALEQNRVVAAEVNDDETSTLVACGSPVDEQQIIIVDPETGVPSAPASVGEIWVAGESIASGYWKRPEETRLTFGARVAGNEEVSFLRTGDLGFLHEGELFVTGRLKDLIIIRGRNLYPQEIERTVQEAHVQLRPGGCAAFSVDVNGEERLIVVQEAERGALSGEEVINAIRQAVVEEHEVQPYAILLVKAGSVPKTSSGKVQRRASRKLFLANSFQALAEWRESGTVQSSAPVASVQSPRSLEEIEQWLSLQLAARIGVEAAAIDLQKPITHYGVDSLSTIELMHSIETSLGVVIPFTNFYRSPSLSDVAAEAVRQLSERETDSLVEIPVEIAAGPVGPSSGPLSPGQEALWFLYRLEPENAAYNVPVTVRLRNEIDVIALRSAFQLLVDRHAALRTTFRLHDGAVVQQVHQHVPVSFEAEEAAGWDEARLAQRFSEQAWVPFDLEAGPLFRIYLMKRAADDFLLQVVAHHIVSDLWSLTILLGELAPVYAALKNGATRDTAAALLPGLEAEYPDYVREQARLLEGEGGARLWSFWAQNLAGQLPALNLLTDRPRAAKTHNRGKIQAFNLDAELTRQLDQLSRRSGASLYMTCLAAYAVLLSRYTGQDEIVIGSPIAGRTRAAYGKVVGYFVNLLPLRMRLEGNPRFVELLERTQTATLDAFAHQEYPFPLIVQRLQPEREAGRTPLFQATFVMQQTPMVAGQEVAPFALGAGDAQLQLGELTLESFPLAERVTQFELTLAVASDGAELRGLFEYNSELFDATTIESMAQHLTELLTAITIDPKQRIASLPLLTRTEQQQLLTDWNETERAYPVAASMLSLFQAQAQRTPDAGALTCNSEHLSYRELDERSNQLAHHLRERGVDVEQVVGVLLPRTPELIVTLLAILKSGAAYLPLDPSYPWPRLQLMLEGSAATLLITTEALSSVVHVDTPLLCLDLERDEIANRPAQPLADVKLDADNLAYLIYTSGSTGQPKPVGITHRSVLTLLHWTREVFSDAELSGMLASTSVCFDLSVFELFVPLSWGGEVILVNNVLELATMAGRERVGLINTVPSAMAEVVRSGAVPEGVLVVNLAGEALPRTLVQEIYEQTRVKRVLNLYGPSEDTTYSTWSEVARDATPTIGRPLANTQAYILDRELQPAPVGVAGELYLGGEGLARGYLRRPEQTAEKFIPHPFSRESGKRMYRTGDLCRWLASGEIEFLGRIDNQVKLRGFRIELGEIEAVLARHESVRACLVTARQDATGDQRLVAYLAANEEIETAELRQYLGERLPAYMIPALFVRLETLPLLSNGKVDRKALPEPEKTAASEREYVAPRTPTEETLARIWAEALNVERVGVNDNFFNLGGHSLLATRVITRINDAYPQAAALRNMFEKPTLADLALLIEQAQPAKSNPPILIAAQPRRRKNRARLLEDVAQLSDQEAREILKQRKQSSNNVVEAEVNDEPRIVDPEISVPSALEYPLSPNQEALWFLYRLEPENAAYNVPVTVRLRNEVDVTALRSAFQLLVDRHAALRTTFRLHDGVVVQQVHEHVPVSFEAEEATGWDEASLAQRLSEQAWIPFDLEAGPLFRIYLMKRAADDFLLQVVAHHIVSDLWSLTILLGELAPVYAALKNGATRDTAAALLPRLEAEYPDYVREQTRMLEGEGGARLWSFWAQNLAGQLPALNLLTDRPRAAKTHNRGKIQAFNLDAELTRQLDQLSRRSGASLYMTCLAAYAVLLSRYTGQDEIVIGSPIAGRTRAAYGKVVGYFVNLLPLRMRLEGNPRFVELLERTQTATLDAFAHQEYPFPLIVQRLQPEREAGRTPLFQATFVMQQTPMVAGQEVAPFALGAGDAQLQLGELTLESFPLAERVTQFELTLAVASDGAGLRGLFEYNSELFDATTIESMAQHLTELLTSITIDPEQRIASLPLLTRTEQQQLLGDWNETERAYPVAASMLSLFETQAQQTPDASALTCNSEHLSYREVDERSNQLAHHLRERGVDVEQVVGVLLPRTPELIVTLLAILKSGAAYLPLDPTYPAPRLQLMLEGSAATLLITTEALSSVVYDAATPLLCLDLERDAIANRPAQALTDVKLDADNLAYLIYTSGSTGQPKPVGITHRSVLTLLHWTREVFSDAELSGMLASASICFDLSVFEIFVPLSWGGEVILVNNVLELATMAGRERVRSISAVPSAMAEVVRSRAVPEGVLTVNFGGEALPRTLVQEIYEQTGVKRVLNLYGPSEDTMCSTWKEVARDATPTIGRPLANTQAYILDRELQPAPVGVAGELYLGGEGLARGYLRRPEQTAEKFVPHPFSRDGGKRLYRTGDLCRWLASGEIEFLGRIDNQVKLRGFRIELGEIEAALARHENVRACVVVRQDASAGQRLVAYLVANLVASEEIETAELRRYLGQRLPAYMIPALFVRLETLPLLSNGKIDRNALPEPEETAASEREYAAPRTPVEAVVARIWAEALKVERAGINDNFFDLGGNSLLLNEVQSKLSAALKRELPLVELFHHPTVESLARYLSDGEQQEIAEESSRAKTPRGKEETGQELIAIIGMAGRFPGAKSIDELWQNLCAGVESVSVFSEEELSAAGVSPAVFNRPDYVKAKPVLADMELFDASFFGFNPREAEIMDPQHRVFLECASDVLENAGYDPDRYRGKIGVYAGASLSTYLFKALMSLNGLESLGALQQVVIGSGLWSLATRASYKLNLKGPSVSIQTACSTSLAAVHMACQSLLNHECDIALAGGASITVANNEGYLYQEGGIFSPDGHCRAFDANARGTIVGDGVALVVLKRLPEAIADGDTIHGLVLGSAMNNDGSVKVGFTAPSVEGQTEVIRAAHASAGITADSIGYVEAHGTGTPLGDPIEVQALTRAFRATTDRKGFCGLGSIKTNIGHLDTAAGVAGLIKTVLALKHKQLPPSLHFEKPNPQIDFVNSPFYVNTTLAEWKVNGQPRRAGVSSFGLGGTNVHVVVEEPPALNADPGPGRPWNLLVLSARTERALAAASANLKEHLQPRSDLNMSDVAYTCQVGRKAFRERQAIVCSDREDCVQVLETGDRRRILRGTPDQAPFVVFMFPGQGSQHVNMAAELYRAEQIFKEVVDQCCEYLEPELGFDLRSLLFADETSVAEITARLNQTSAAQPALFVIEYALARLWMEWGIRPEAMIGHSIGEYVAACLAGVFSLEDALTLVAARGKLIDDLPAGAMLAIPFSEAEALTFLDDELSLAASNSHQMSVVSGPVEAIDRLEEQLTEQDLICHRLHTSHAFHSVMVEPIMETFADLVARANPRPPQMPLISTLTGTWMESSEATDPQYWSKHLRHTIRFARGLETLSENRRLVLIEVGPCQHLSGLAAGQLDGEKCSVVSSLPHPRQPRSEVASMLEALGRLWILGVNVDWHGFNARQRRRRVPLPTYPFERRRYWVEAQPVASQQQITPEASVPEWRPPTTVATFYPRPALREPYVAPANELQRKIAEVWQRVLAIEEIGINDDFFELGGNSLVATQLVTELRESFKMSIPLRGFFEARTIAALSATLETAEVVKEIPKVKPIPRDSFRRKVLTVGSKV